MVFISVSIVPVFGSYFVFLQEKSKDFQLDREMLWSVRVVRKIGMVLLLSLFCMSSYARDGVVPQRTVAGDTLPHFLLDEVKVKGKSPRKYIRRQSRLEYHVRKVYPYACMAARKTEEIDRQLALVSTPKEGKEIIRREYQGLMKTFRKPLMRLSFTQGRILLKLIYRETDNTAFSHIREYKGGLNTYFWQSVALVFGNNLKAGYDPKGKDAEIEKIVLKIKSEEEVRKNGGK